MSYAGKFIGQNVGSWLGPVDSDPNALYAGLSGSGAAAGTLTALGQLQAALFGGGDLAADLTYIEAAEVIDAGIGQGDGGKGAGVGRFRHTDVRSNLVIDLEASGRSPTADDPQQKPARQHQRPAQQGIERSRTAELTGKVIAEAMAGAARDAAAQAATVAAQAKAEARAKTLALVIALAEADDD